MPTIEQLDAARAAGDADFLMLSQNGVARKATRAQVVAGLQPALAVPQGRLLGRSTAGSGPPEALTRLSQLTPVLGILARRGAGKRLKSQVSA